ncbi:MAG: hypothetical protein KDJ73_12685 [Notoacmeibacter sp.]|nr:hypothetical protein [Notoacmeibacter sp.]MCC0031838.1 hypothetical protein [Brucellaceae bacterium]
MRYALTFALVVVPLFAPAALADQAECEKSVRALLFPLMENKPDKVLNRFGTVQTIINGAEQRGYSFQSRGGSVYYDGDKNPVSLSFSTGETYWSPDKGKTWNLVNPNSKEVMDAAMAGLRSQAEKATNITCDYGVEFEGKTVNHYKADHVIYNTGDKVHTEYWVDPENGFVWRDLNHTTGSAEVISDVRAEPAPDMKLPDKPN